ncbi:sensor histidine kinase [Pseudomonas sp. MM211]|uniref:sensor histidine kinase n=1 Tax=Pseudomonas sp. MM211 TaxID=2866808 RepID=UPI001CEC0540|nr:sensor histidine kinase [Pseudomonas sp. MM211]UCJ17456.1 sensor histidine kinase [Pseudomonas sp. MM211]
MTDATMLSQQCSQSRTQQNKDTDAARHRKRQAKLYAMARAQERKRIARELHDELGQQLTALQQGLGVLRIHLKRERPDLSEQILHLISISHSAINAIRDVQFGGPIGRLRHDLENTLRNLTEDFKRLSGIPCRCSLPAKPIDLKPEQASHLYRIVQESLTNIVRHANAGWAAVSLERRDNDYVLEISDDGCGFTLSDTLPDSTGLSGMRERGKRLGGPVIIFSHPGQGTIVQAIFPVKPRSQGL